MRSDELLDDSLTMKEVSQIYGLYSKVRKISSCDDFVQVLIGTFSYVICICRHRPEWF